MVTSKNCLNCGAPIETDKCPYCGTAFIDFACISADEPFFMKINHKGTICIIRVRLISVSVEPPDMILYADNHPFYSNCNTLDMSFEVLDAGERINEYYNVIP